MTPEEIAALKAENEKMKTDHAAALKSLQDEMEKLKKPPEADPSLAEKAKKEREEADKKKNYEKSLGSALKFNMSGAEFLKENAGLLPKTVEGIFAQAEKRKYDSEVEKANQIKVGVVSEFFAVQANMDHLTGSQKVELEEFLKLTENAKQDRIENVYAMIFEPTLESIRKVEKAKQVNSGTKDQSTVEKQLADRMMKQSKKHYLGDKE